MGEISPVPTGITDTANERTVLPWLNDLVRILERDATTEKPGRVLKMPVQADSTATTVADLKDDLNALLAKLKTAGLMEE